MNPTTTAPSRAVRRGHLAQPGRLALHPLATVSVWVTLLGMVPSAASWAAEASAISLVIDKHGNRRLGELQIAEGIVTCTTSQGKVHLPLAEIAEIVGPHAELVKPTERQRIEHRCPELDELMGLAYRHRLAGSPPGLELLKSDERWEIWLSPSKENKKKVAKVHKHLTGIINKMQFYFPKGEKPRFACKVRVFDDAAAFTAWRDRASGLPPGEVLAQVLHDFYLADDAVMLADLRSFDEGVTSQIDSFKTAAGRLISDSSGAPAALLQTFVLMTALAVACTENERGRVLRSLDSIISSAGSTLPAAGGPAPTLPDADPTTGGEAGFINYGYYSPATEELVLWWSDEFWTTVSHETFHYWMHHNCPDAPIWINEGFATYFETFSPNGREKHQGFHFDRFRELKSSTNLVPLKDLLVLPTQVWQGQEGRLQSFLYAQSWAFLHFLLHGEEYDFGDKGKKLLKSYLTGLAEGQGHEQAAAAFFKEDFDLEVLEPKFLYYVQRLKPPPE